MFKQYKEMQPKIPSRRTFVVTLLLIGLLSAVYSFWPSMRESIQFSVVPVIDKLVVLVVPEKIMYGEPLRLRIPAINVDALVEGTGVLANGEMGIPAGPDGVAWFKFGPHPGETGSAVIDGHYGWKDSIPAVFDNLKKLQPGEKVSIEDDNGLIINFVVREIREFNPKEDASNVFNSYDGKSHLNLVTCDGPWNRNTASRPTRLVVFTDKE